MAQLALGRYVLAHIPQTTETHGLVTDRYKFEIVDSETHVLQDLKNGQSPKPRIILQTATLAQLWS